MRSPEREEGGASSPDLKVGASAPPYGEAEIHQSSARAKQLGISPLVIDEKQEFTEQWLSEAIQANSDYNGYPVSTSMNRQLIAALVAQPALEVGCDALMEGSTGKSNDQYRMHNVFNLFFPDIRSIKSASFNQKECAPAAHIRGLPYQLIARRNKLAGIFSGQEYYGLLKG